MAKAPWFKFYAADFVTDPKIDSIPIAARYIVVHMWCLQWIHGRIPADPKELARLMRIDVLDMQMHYKDALKFFKQTDDGYLYSERMDLEMERSEKTSFIRKQAANTRWNQQDNANAYAKGNAKPHAKQHMQMDMQSESESDIKPLHASKRGTRLPETFQVTDDHREFSKKHSLPSPELFIDEFRDYWIARPGQGGCKLDWDATFRNWIRNNATRKGNGKSNGNGQQTLIGGLEQVLSHRRANGFHD